MIVFESFLWYLMFLCVYPFVSGQDVPQLTNLEHIVKLRCQLIAIKYTYMDSKEKRIKKCAMENPQNYQNTPEVPTNLTVSSIGNEKRFDIKWEMPLGEEHKQKYHIETRFYLGVYKPVSELYYSPWQWQNLQQSGETIDTEKKLVILNYSMKVRRGYWYQFRVAAINTYGYKEISAPSKPFKIEMDPKSPAEPKFLMIDSYNISNTKNNTINVTLSWCPAKSDVPIKRYKISWALHIMDNYINSVLLKHGFVSGDQQSFKIPNLRIDDNYFIFIQAISVYGNRKLKSNITVLGENGYLLTKLPLNTSKTNIYKCSKQSIDTVQLKDMENMIDSDFSDNIKITFHISSKNHNSLTVSVGNVNTGTHLEICGPKMCPFKSIWIFPEKKRYNFSEMEFNTEYSLKIHMKNHFYIKNFTTPMKHKLLTVNFTNF